MRALAWQTKRPRFGDVRVPAAHQSFLKLSPPSGCRLQNIRAHSGGTSENPRQCPAFTEPVRLSQGNLSGALNPGPPVESPQPSLCKPRIALTRTPTSLARCTPSTTALISVTRQLCLLPIPMMPSIVHPAGSRHRVLQQRRVIPRLQTTRAAPMVVCAASSVATSRGNPTFTPASASDSRMM